MQMNSQRVRFLPLLSGDTFAYPSFPIPLIPEGSFLPIFHHLRSLQSIDWSAILPQGSKSTSGSSALHGNVAAALAVADTVRSTYGPRGMDKLLVDSEGHFVVTNDGATILSLLNIQHPVASLIVRLSKHHDREVGDGTTGVALLAASLLSHSLELYQRGIHPHTIIRGYRKALYHCESLFPLISFPVDLSDSAVLSRIASVPLQSKVLRNSHLFFASMLVEAAQKLGPLFSSSSVRILSLPGGSLEDTLLLDGLAWRRTFSYAGADQQPKRIEKPRILLLDHEVGPFLRFRFLLFFPNTPFFPHPLTLSLCSAQIELKHQKEYARLVVDDPSEYMSFVESEWELVEQKLNAVVVSAANVILDCKPIGDVATQRFAKHGIACASRLPVDVMRCVQQCTNGSVLASLDGLEADSPALGSCDLFQELVIDSERVHVLSGCHGTPIMTILLRGGSMDMLSEAERSLHDSICVLSKALQSGRILLGAGVTEARLAQSLEVRAQTASLPEDTVVSRAFGESLLDLPTTLCRNAGVDAPEAISRLRSAHALNTESTFSNLGLDLMSSVEKCEPVLCDVLEAGVWEPLQVKACALRAAVEVACTVLSIDHMILLPQNETEDERTARIAVELKAKRGAQEGMKRAEAMRAPELSG